MAPPARLLDVGAGRGRFVAAARAAGYAATGIEPSQRGALAAAALGEPVERLSIAATSVPEQSLDAVTLWHVLEHLDDPAPALERIGAWLRPGGALLVGVPNLASLQAALGGERWYHLDVPRHRVHFTPAGLHRLLRAHGLTPARTVHVLGEHNPFGLWQSLVNRLTRYPSYLDNVLKHNAPVRSSDLAITVLAVPLAPLAALVELLAGLRRPRWHRRRAGPARARARHRLPFRSWKEADSVVCSVTRMSCSAGSVSSPSRCRAPSGSPGLTTRSSLRST